ncbi:glycoside hydrolase family 3 protein [Arthrobacter bambusae]|uniref:glycoside hydrolase family 3 protein n=1 Tax=Arthrobacter TaxID=1663 RepID=UPI001F50CE27|nr:MULTISPECIES: glycoside hydrolase family 3 protein [Arthrobacter]MCI0141282.1 glycoside hydrolase family 3 protein [Arthrobacter bambusae]UYY82135.1 glycoside hydrolase family 3 protein [Arthrobacter sp. YA7-1]
MIPTTGLQTLTAPDGTKFRDLNGNGVMDPFENPHLSAEERVADLIPRLSLEEKAGLMFHTVIETGPEGTLLERPGNISKSATSVVILDKKMNHFNVHALGTPREAARWSNALQKLAEGNPHGIPVTISTDPRHAFIENSGVSFKANHFSQWPEPIGLAATGDRALIRRFADIARQEYTAVGIRAALHPTVDLSTEPRWARQAGTFGQDWQRTSDFATAYLEGLQGGKLSADSVACTTKHFPGGGPQKDGEDAHFPYGREQTYTGGRFGEHLEPFKTAIAHNTSAIMPYYGMPVGLEIDGEPVEEVGFGYNKQIITGLLREKLGYDGVVLSDWELVNDNIVGDQVLPARAWGVEHLTAPQRMLKILNAGVDQFGGEECTGLLIDLVREGLVDEGRLDESVRRLLLVKFRLGLFDNPYVDEDAAAETVGNPRFQQEGHNAQAQSVTILTNQSTGNGQSLPMRPGLNIYLEGMNPASLEGFATPVTDPESADVAIVRLHAPWDHRDDLFLEAWFHAGSLEFPPGLIHRLRTLAQKVPLIIDVALDRPAILTPLVDIAAALTGTFGVSDKAFVDAITGVIPARGRLPFEIPASMDGVRTSRPDVPGDTGVPLFAFDHGLALPVRDLQVKA